MKASNWVSGLLAAAAMVALGASASAQTDHEKQLYDAAKAEGSVTWYSGILDQPMDDPHRACGFQVEHEALLAGIELAEIGAVAVAKRRAQAHLLAFRRFDLDHLGADIRQQARAVRAGQHDGEIQHADAAER